MPKREYLWEQLVEQKAGAYVEWTKYGVPICTDERCDHFDGKRCLLIGLRPGNICEPLVVEMADVLMNFEKQPKKEG